MFGGVSNLLPISANYSLKSQIGIGKNWVGPPPRDCVVLIFLWCPMYDGFLNGYGVVSCRDSDGRMGVCLSGFCFHFV